MKIGTTSKSPDETYRLGEQIGGDLLAGDIVLLYGGLGAGKTLLVKGIMNSLGYDVDEVTSPSFTLVNEYRTERFTVYHIDLWRLDPSNDPAGAVGLDEIVEVGNSVAVIEWADHLGKAAFSGRVIRVNIEGDGDDPRQITVESES